MEIFTREKIGVETTSLADSFLLGVLNGRLRENVVHFKTVADAAKGMAEGKVAAVLGSRAELEAATKGQGKVVLDSPKFAELKIDSWPLGMAVKVEDQALAEAIGTALAGLKNDGTIADIFKRYGISHQAN